MDKPRRQEDFLVHDHLAKFVLNRYNSFREKIVFSLMLTRAYGRTQNPFIEGPLGYNLAIIRKITYLKEILFV